MYLCSGDTSSSAAELRIAWYSRSWRSSYELAATCPAQRRQAWLTQSADVRGWKGVTFRGPFVRDIAA
jgi:hypothetical protein